MDNDLQPTHYEGVVLLKTIQINIVLKERVKISSTKIMVKMISYPVPMK